MKNCFYLHEKIFMKKVKAKDPFFKGKKIAFDLSLLDQKLDVTFDQSSLSQDIDDEVADELLSSYPDLVQSSEETDSQTADDNLNLDDYDMPTLITICKEMSIVGYEGINKKADLVKFMQTWIEHTKRNK